jgi:glutathione S-transferase
VFTFHIRLSAAGAHWENHFVDSDTWPALKGTGLAPFGQVPILEVRLGEGAAYVLAESHAIVRHIAREFGFDGANEYERSVSDMLMERLSDLRVSISKVFYPEAERKTRVAEWVAKEWPLFSAELDRFIARNASSFLVGPSFTACDIAWYAMFSLLESFGLPRSAVVSAKQVHFLAAMESIPGIAAFLKSEKNPARK